MFDKLIDVLILIWDMVCPLEILRVYERGVRLRGGHYVETLGPGWYGKIPLWDTIMRDNVVTRTKHMSSQPLETADGKTVQVAGILRFQICDIKKALLDVEGVDDAIRDIGSLVIADAVKRVTYAELRSAEFSEVLTKAARKRGWRYGIEVEELGLYSLSPGKTLVVVNPSARQQT
jgi:regulator of protease activity HflC (stomatin/prohibitin superfamily)